MKAIRPLCVPALALFLFAPAAICQVPRDPTPVVSKNSPADVAAGKTLYEATCSKCHSLDGGGSGGPRNPVTYAVDGKQYVFVTAGTTYFVFGPP